MNLTLLLWNCAVATLAVAAVIIMASFQRAILLAFVIALSLFTGIQFWNAAYHDSQETMGFIKLMFLLPFGLGSLLIFSCLPQAQQKKYLTWFTRYINFAVAANIFIMVFTPDGDTWRGIVSRFVCLALLIWLLQEMAKQAFQTTHFEDGFFIFRASPLQWVFGHAAYRLVLLSLPAFDSLAYLLLEPLSLLAMLALHQLHRKRYPLSHYFGFADTLVVTTLAVLSRYPILPPFETEGFQLVSLSQQHLDILFLPMQFAVIGFALWAIRSNSRVFAQRPWRLFQDCAKLPTGKRAD